ncbi:MAG TPA: hypothetical protein VGK73_03130, partial [Polyangiaceae bacterium]
MALVVGQLSNEDRTSLGLENAGSRGRAPQPHIENDASGPSIGSVPFGGSVGIYRFWRDLGYAVGALVAGV